MARILITGANRGIGFELTRQYCERGDQVIAAVRAPAKATELEQLARKHPQLQIVQIDVTDDVSAERAANALGAEAVDVVICNAGMMESRGGIADNLDGAAAWSRVLMTNVAGVFFTARAMLPHLRRARAGKLAIISSMMGSSANAAGGSSSYRASKAAAANLGANFAIDLKPMGVAVGIYHPGWVSTDMGGAAAPVRPADSAKGLIDRIDRLSLTSTGVFEDYNGQTYDF